MADTFTEQVTIGVESETVDPDSLATATTIADPDYSGPARLKWVSTAVSSADAAGQSVATQDVVLKLPVGSPIIPTGRLVIVSSSSIDPGLAGRRFRVAGRPASGQVTANRYTVEEVS